MNSKSKFSSCFRISPIFVLLFVLFSTASVSPQTSAAEPLGWDLTYAKVFERNKVGPQARIRALFWPDMGSVVARILEDLNGERIMSAAMIERPSFSSSYMNLLLFVRTKNAAYFWESTDRERHISKKNSIDPRRFDRMFKDLGRFEQATPVPAKENGSGWEGFWGVLNTYKKGSARQMPLTIEDLYVLNNEPPKAGRVAVVVDQVLSSVSAPSALIYSSCSIRPTRSRLTELFGPPVNCGPEFGAESAKDDVCFRSRGQNVRASFNSFDQVTTVFFSTLIPRYLMARILPTASWLSSTRNRVGKSPPIQSLIVDGKFSESVFEDDCVKIRTVVLNAQTSLPPGYIVVTWN